MEAMKEFTIPFVGLKEGKHQFEFTIDNTFFAHFEYDDFNLHPKHIKVIEINATTAVAMYYAEGNVQAKGAENNANYLTRAMQVYVKEGGVWKIRAAHWSPIIGGKGTTETASNQ